MSRFWAEAKEVGFESVFALDFEGGDRTGVVEFGVVEIKSHGVADCWTGLCSPSEDIPRRESETHGLWTHNLKDREPFAAYWEFFRDLRRKGPFLAHSAQVEDRFLRRQWRTPGEVVDWSGKSRTGIGWGPWLDSCGIFRSIYPSSPAGLGHLVGAENLGAELDDLAGLRCPEGRARWHAALYDTLASALLFGCAVGHKQDWGVGQFFRASRGEGVESGEQMGLL